MRKFPLHLIAILIVAAASLRAEQPADKPVLLLTGFEPFGGLKVNASWETAKTFEGAEIGGYQIRTALLPVVYDEMEKPLLDAIQKNHPRIVISMGVGTKVVQVETIARNGYHPQKPPDNKGKPPPRAEIVVKAPKEIPTALPADAIVAALKKANIGAKSSTDAGGYLCNECFYRLMNASVELKARGFIHVPDFGTADPEGGTFDKEKLRKAIEIAIATTIQSVK